MYGRLVVNIITYFETIFRPNEKRPKFSLVFHLILVIQHLQQHFLVEITIFRSHYSDSNVWPFLNDRSDETRRNLEKLRMQSGIFSQGLYIQNYSLKPERVLPTSQF